MTKRLWWLFSGWTCLFVAPLLMDLAADEQGEGLTYSNSIRHVESVIPHGKTVGSVVLTALWALLMYHFHWQNQVAGQKW